MINLALKTEYSFKKCFGHIKELVEACDKDALGIADEDNTYGHIQFSKLCKAKGIKPIFGVRLRAPFDEKQRTGQSYWVFLAKNDEGLKEIYALVARAYENFYFFPRLHMQDIIDISENVVVICPDYILGVNELTNYEFTKRPNYKMITPYDTRRVAGRWHVAMQDNYYPNEADKEIYELLAGAQKRNDGYMYNFENRVCEMHIVPESSMLWDDEMKRSTELIADECNANIEQAEMVKFSGSSSIRDLCIIGAKRLGIPISSENEYGIRLDRELSLIEDKGYEDYFLIVADMLRYANKQMLVGPSRGSSAGSLVCYLMDITKIDPLEYDLLFERFIDINRHDLPDIDIDFPDSKRHLVTEYLSRKYGEHNVKALANINRLKAKSAIDLFGMGLTIPKKDCETVKNAMIERSSGDARNAMCIGDTFNDTEPGQEFIKEYPKMRLVERIENHAQHAGKHAAGIIVSNKALTNFGGINSRDGVIMLDKRDAEDINLLKIDCLGLTTLSILEDAAKLAKMHKDDYYKLPLDDEDTFKIFNDGRLNGIFQFEGQALKMLTKSFNIVHFDDIVAITALARPGALRSGGAAKFAKRKTGESEPEYFGEKHKLITESTMGIMVYQEQMMHLARELANFSWMEISDMRKAASKSLGDDYFRKYEDKFIAGCQEFSGVSAGDADLVWKDIQHAGSWIFNKSHAVAYGMLSYYTAYMKAHFPIEFYAASLNHAKSDDSALRILRDAVENDGIDYIPVDPDESDVMWKNVDGVLVGGLCNIKGVAEKKAKQIIRARKGQGRFTPSLLKMLENPVTPFDILFPTKHYWGKFFDNPAKLGLFTAPTLIKDLAEPKQYAIIGRLIDRNLNDLNEYNKVQKRGHRLEEDTLYLNIIVEDDYDSIMCSIGRYDYVRLGGRAIAEKAKVGEDWFLIRGKLGTKWRGITVEEILNLTEWEKKNAEAESKADTNS